MSDGDLVRVSGGLVTSALPLTAQADPAAPPAGTSDIYAKTTAGRDELWFRDHVGRPASFQRLIADKNILLMLPHTTTTIDSIGGSNVSVGTASTPAFTEAFGSYTNWVSGASAGNTAGNSGAANRFCRGSVVGFNGFWFVSRLVFPDASYGAGATGSRLFTGMCNSSLAVAIAADDPGAQHIGFAYSTNRGDTNWQISSEAGSGQALTDTLLPFTAQHVHRFGLFCAPQGATVFARVDDITAGTTSGDLAITSSLPAAGQLLKPGFQVATLSAVARNIGMLSLYCEPDL